MRRSVLLMAALGALPMTGLAQDGTVLQRFEQDMRRLVDKVKPSVVTVSAQVPLLEVLHGAGTEDEQFAPGDILITNVGSGVIFDTLHVITHQSVIMNSQQITLTTQDGREVPATLVGSDPLYGIAVLRSSVRLHNPAVLTQAGALKPGSYVTVVGNALGVSAAVSWGIVNAVRQDGLIQLAANIPAGNVGGPVFDSSGRLAGLLAGLIVPTGAGDDAESVGDAALVYPVQEIAANVQAIIHDGRMEAGWVGVTAEDWPGRLGWIHISDVRPGSPAQEAGLRLGDIILSLDGRGVRSSMELAQYVRHNHPGRLMKLGVLRGDSTRIFEVKIGSTGARETRHTMQSTFSLSGRMSQSSGKPLTQTERRSKVMPEEQLLRRIEDLEKELAELRALIKK